MFKILVEEKENGNELTASNIQELCQEQGKEDIDIDQAHRILLSIKSITDDGRIHRLRRLDEHDRKQTISEEDFLSFVMS